METLEELKNTYKKLQEESNNLYSKIKALERKNAISKFTVGNKTFIGSINSDNSVFTCSSEILFLKEIFEDFTFIDGIPFGIKER